MSDVIIYYVDMPNYLVDNDINMYIMWECINYVVNVNNNIYIDTVPARSGPIPFVPFILLGIPSSSHQNIDRK